MGLFEVDVKVANPKSPDNYLDATMLVDTGATHSMLPSSLLEELGIERKYKGAHCKFGNGQKGTLDQGEASITIKDTAWTVPVLFSEGDGSYLGATTLQIFNLVADPIDHRLVEGMVLHGGARVLAQGRPVPQEPAP